MSTTATCLSLLVPLLAFGLMACSTPSGGGGDAAGEAEADSARSVSRHPTAVSVSFQQDIAAPVATVWDTMFGKDTYSKWTAAFGAGNYFEGTWTEGERMRFLAPGGSGMVSEVAESRRHEVMSLRHLGMVADGVEDTSSDAVTSWAPAYETYRLTALPDGGTRVTVEQDVQPGQESMMEPVWSRALADLKALCEADA